MRELTDVLADLPDVACGRLCLGLSLAQKWTVMEFQGLAVQVVIGKVGF